MENKLQILGKPDPQTGECPVLEERPHAGETLEAAVKAIVENLPPGTHGFCLLDGNGLVIHRWVSPGLPPDLKSEFQ